MIDTHQAFCFFFRVNVKTVQIVFINEKSEFFFFWGGGGSLQMVTRLVRLISTNVKNNLVARWDF